MISPIYLNQVVLVENDRGARYQGRLVGFKQQGARFCLSQLAIINQAGYVAAAPKWNNRRWFASGRFRVVKTV